jgi:hypothetical protein
MSIDDAVRVGGVGSCPFRKVGSRRLVSSTELQRIRTESLKIRQLYYISYYSAFYQCAPE